MTTEEKNEVIRILMDEMHGEKTEDAKVAEAHAKKAGENAVYAIGENIRVPPFEHDYVGKWFARWNRTLLKLADEDGEGAETRLCGEDGREKLIYPAEVFDEVLHIRMQSWETLRVLEFLMNFWYATQPCVNKHPRTVSAVSTRQVGIKLSEIAFNNEDIAKAVEALRHDSYNNGEEYNGEEMRLIPFARIVTNNSGEPILFYTVDWDLARLGFKDYLGEVAEAWANIQYRYIHCLWDKEQAIEAAEDRAMEKAKPDYQEWVMTDWGKKFRESLKDGATRMGKDWEAMTAEEQKDFILNDGFKLWWLDDFQRSEYLEHKN